VSPEREINSEKRQLVEKTGILHLSLRHQTQKLEPGRKTKK
jgi:hypothetical protein